MKKKPTFSSSERYSFRSLKEAKDFFDRSFEELLKQLDDFFDPFESIFLGIRLWPNQTIRLNLERFLTQKTFGRLVNDQYRKFIFGALPKSMDKISYFDPLGESDFYLYLILTMERWAEHLSMVGGIFEWDEIAQRTPRRVGKKIRDFPEWEDGPYIQKPPGLCSLAEVKQRVASERKKIIQGLPGVLAYQNSKEQSKPKKSRNAKAIQKEEDLLYLLDQYESWQAKTTQETRRKKLNPKDWYKNFATWTPKSKRLFGKYAESGDDNSDIVSIIKYAQKIKRERSKGGE